MASTTMNWTQWEPTIRDMVALITCRAHNRESQHPLIGTIQGPFAAGKTVVIPSWVYNNLRTSRVDATVVHVSTQLETAVLIKAQGEEGDSPSEKIPIKRESYGEFLNTLRASLTNVRTDTPPSHRNPTWLNPQVLPPNVVIFVEEDSSLSAEFCLLLVELLGWADTLTQAHGGPFSVSIFVIGSSSYYKVPRFLENVAKAMGAEYFNPMQPLVRPEWQRIYKTWDDSLENLIIHIEQLMMEPAENPPRIAAICYPPWSRVIDLEDICTIRHQVDGLIYSEDLAVFNAVEGRSGPPTLQLICLPYEFRAPVQIGGFDRAFILVSPHVKQTIIDGLTGRLADGSFHIFPEQEMEQSSWAHRFTCPPSSVTVFRDRTRPWNARNAERRVLVGNGQLAGFLAALSNSEFRSSPAAKYAMDLFIVDRTTRRDNLRQLNQMGICRVSDKLEFCSDYGLSGATRSAFYDLLPMFDYDPRLALFVALPCSDLAVINVKIQLAAMIKIGVRNLIQIRIPADIDHKQFHVNLVERYCSGYTARHGVLGSLWALLAIWKSVAISARSFPAEQSALDLRGTVQAMDKMAEVAVPPSRDAIKLMVDVPQVLRHRQNVHSQPTAFSEETSWDASSALALERHLLRCFVHSAVMATPMPQGEHGEGVEWRFYDVGSHKPVERSRWLDLVDFGSVAAHEQHWHEGERGPMFGVSLVTTMIPGESTLGLLVLDWTWIHSRIVGEWLSQHGNGQDLSTILKSQCQFGANRDQLLG